LASEPLLVEGEDAHSLAWLGPDQRAERLSVRRIVEANERGLQADGPQQLGGIRWHTYLLVARISDFRLQIYPTNYKLESQNHLEYQYTVICPQSQI
jgi:hypothetical protein